jgi:hypothetical protein
MPFGLTNAPAAFQYLMHDLFKDLIDVYVIVYLDDILVFSDNMEAHVGHVREVLSRLRNAHLYAKLEKCSFHTSSVDFLGYRISPSGISMDPGKVASVLSWPVPTCLKDVQSFLGFINFYRRFVPQFSSVCAPLYALTKKAAQFIWSEQHQLSFAKLKQLISSEPVLKHPDESLPFVLECDASDFAIAGILSQRDQSSTLRPIAYYSRKLASSEINYDIHDKELLAIIACLKEWRHLLINSTHPVQIITDHKNLEHFTTARQLNRRQARWSIFLADFNYVLIHRSGRLNDKADLLSRRVDFQLGEDDPRVTQQNMTLLPPALFVNAVTLDTLSFPIDPELDWPYLVQHFLLRDVWPQCVLDDAQLQRRLTQEVEHFKIIRNALHRLLPNKETAPYLRYGLRKLQMARYHHGLGHLKFDSIVDVIKRRFWWPTLDNDLRQFIRECSKCQLNAQDRPVTVPVRPVPPSALPFDRWGLDFVQDLPETKNGNRHIITAIDYGTRWVVAKAVKSRTTAEMASFLYDLLMNYGAPYEIITDRASSLLSDTLREYTDLQNIRHIATTPHHPQTNGMVERMHATLGNEITCLVDGKRDRWDEFLPQALFALRVRRHAVTKQSPFYLLYGVHPRLPQDTEPLVPDMAPLDEIELMEERGQFTARTLDELGHHRAAAYERSRVQAEAMRRRHNFDPNSPLYRYKVGDWVKYRHHDRMKFEYRWKGPYVVVDVGFPGTYWLMSPDGRRFDSTTPESDLRPWLGSPDNEFYDGTRRSRPSEGEVLHPAPEPPASGAVSSEE